MKRNAAAINFHQQKGARSRIALAEPKPFAWGWMIEYTQRRLCRVKLTLKADEGRSRFDIALNLKLKAYE